MESPMLTDRAVEACTPWRTERLSDGPMSYTLEATQIAQAFLAAQDRDALARILLDQMAAIYGYVPNPAIVRARAIIDVLLGDEGQ